MNLELDEHQQEIRSLAADLFTRKVDPARIEKVEATPDRFDSELWSAIADSGLLGVTVPDEHGGLGFGAVELALVLEQLGRAVAPVPLVGTTLAAWTLAALGSNDHRQRWLPKLLDGSGPIAIATEPSTATLTADGETLTGDVIGVAWAHVASALLLPVDGRLFLLPLDDAGITTTRGETTAREVALDLRLDGVRAEPVGQADAATWLRLRHAAALAAVQAGVTAAALRMTASYTSEREQFGKPLSTFQAVALKAADAYLDAVAVRSAALQAAVALDDADDPTLEVLTAAWWAAEGGQRCVHLTQHLHGGMGADITYPVHRFFLWGKQIELLLGGASALLAELGDALDARPDAGDAIRL